MTMKDDRGESEACQLRRELFDDRLLDELIAATTDRGIALTGEGGFDQGGSRTRYAGRGR